MWVADHQGIVAKARVLCRIRDDEQLGLQDGVGANRTVDRRLAHPQAYFGLEPLPPLVDQIDDGNWSVADSRRDLNDFVEVRLSRRIKNIVPTQGVETVFLGAMKSGFQENFLI